jgi:hypothetical protein
MTESYAKLTTETLRLRVEVLLAELAYMPKRYPGRSTMVAEVATLRKAIARRDAVRQPTLF